MGFGKWLSTQLDCLAKKGNDKEISTEKATGRKGSRGGEKQRKSSLSSATAKDASSDTSSVAKMSANVQLVEAWMAAWAAKDMDRVLSLSTENCEYLVPVEGEDDSMQIKMQDFIDQMQITYASFPDYHTSWEKMRDGKSKPGTVVLKNFVSKGTHTGEPYAFGPFPAIDAKGASIKDDPVSLVVSVQDGKVRSIGPQLTTGMIGPANYYTQIGGVIP